jgi:hypothetical protein
MIGGGQQGMINSMACSHGIAAAQSKLLRISRASGRIIQEEAKYRLFRVALMPGAVEKCPVKPPMVTVKRIAPLA